MPRKMGAAVAVEPTIRVPLTDNSFPLEHGDPVVLMVKRKGNEHEITEFHRQHGGKVTRFKHIAWDAVEVRGNAYGRYKNSPLFERVEFQRIYNTHVTPNDPLFGQQWDLTKIEAPAAWDKQTSNDVVVAVIDTGIDFNHPDLISNLWTGPQGEHGYTAANGVITNGGQDDHFHGTHCAGSIGAVTDNNVGISGINWRVKLMAMKFLNAGGNGATRDAVLCLEKLIDLKQAGHNIRVSNNSWGAFGNLNDPALEEAFQEAENNGILSVCAAGNNGADIDIYGFTPAGIPLDGIVSVLASDANDLKASFSNFGSTSTDLLAPGVGILAPKLNGGYWALSGTSMATPHVAGAAAMLFAFNPGLQPVQAKTILLQPESYDRTSFTENSTGGGRLNLRKLWNNPAIGNPPPPNHAPTLVLDTPTNFLIVPIGQHTTINASGIDPDGDNISFHTTATAFRDNWFPQTWWEFPHFAFNQPISQITVETLPLALDQRVKIRFSATDGHGGGKALNQSVWSFRDESKVRDLRSGILSFTNWFAGGKYWFRLNCNTNIVRPGARYTVEVRPQPSPWGWDGEVNKDVQTQMVFPSAGAYAARAFLIDTDGNFATSPRAQIIVSNSTQRAPEARMSINTRRGVAPLEVIADMSASQKGSATQLQFGVVEWRKSGVNVDIFNPVRTLTLTEPGVYELLFYCADTSSGLEDRILEFITVLPKLPAKLKIRRNGNRPEVSWEGNGILQESAQITGPYTDSPSQANPQIRTPAGMQFFKLR